MLSEDYLIEQLNAPTKQERPYGHNPALRSLWTMDSWRNRPEPRTLTIIFTLLTPFLPTAPLRQFGAPILRGCARPE